MRIALSSEQAQSNWGYEGIANVRYHQSTRVHGFEWRV